jgi:hypothetical protein
MATAVALDASPMSFIRSFRGAIVLARIAYPDILHIEVRDSRGAVWRLATQDASFSPSDPALLVDRTIGDAHIDEASGELRCRLSDGSMLSLEPPPASAPDDPPNWELISPTGLVLEFGPGVRWRFSSIDASESLRR